MRKLIFTCIAMMVVLAALAQNTQDNKKEEVPGPQITFEEESYDFGDIEQGDVVEHTFKFENKGTEPLIISNVAVTCGCTATKWPREPIPAGEGGEITIKFNSTGKMGAQNKSIRIFSNAQGPLAVISIVTNVLPKKKDN